MQKALHQHQDIMNRFRKGLLFPGGPGECLCLRKPIPRLGSGSPDGAAAIHTPMYSCDTTSGKRHLSAREETDEAILTDPSCGAAFRLGL
uniref:Uncharacterized protein n=1 Tax=Knipowitschia caucasica TaxID=637954 RepID=A0AAV2MF37_KNICA